MRIISGKYKGRHIRPPGNLPVRPTTDFAKTGLFNILEHKFDIETLDCLDLFSGTGSISLELISRGCKHVTAIDQDQKCVVFLRKTADELGIDNLVVHRNDAIQYLKKTHGKFDFIFADPPFSSDIHEELVEHVMQKELLKPNGLLILEHISRQDCSTLQGFQYTRKYGNVAFSFFFTLVS